MKLRIGVRVLSLLAVSAVGLAALGAERADTRPSKQATETKFCVCCASLIPIKVGCACAPLQ